MLDLLRIARRELIAWTNRKSVDALGRGVELRGTVEKRHPRGRIEIGDGCRIDGQVITEVEDSHITIGRNTLLGSRSIIDCVTRVIVGDDVLISYDVIIADADNHSLSRRRREGDLERWRAGTHDWSDVQKAPITIGNGAWIGARAIILRGVTIGEGAIVGMGSVVTKDVAPNTIVAGNPARVVRELPDEG
jgi:acetyltransferase-like isoleucine patch superfamily enzyme